MQTTALRAKKIRVFCQTLFRMADGLVALMTLGAKAPLSLLTGTMAPHFISTARLADRSLAPAI
jgi:hypothetical protein